MNNTLKTIFWIGLGYFAAKKLPELNEKKIQDEAKKDIAKAGNEGEIYYQKFKDFLNKKDNNDTIIVEPCPAAIKKPKGKMYY